MKFIEGQDRTQTHLFPVSLDASIDQDHEVRLIDLFVDSVNLEDFGFNQISLKMDDLHITLAFVEIVSLWLPQ